MFATFSKKQFMGLKANKKNQAPEVSDEKKTEFFLAASHQLKAPIAIIQWCLQTVLEDTSKLDKNTLENVRRSVLQADAMSNLVTDMLHVFKLMRNQDDPQSFTQVNVNEVIDEIFEQYLPISEKKKVRLNKGVIEILPMLSANQGYFRQVIINLLDNAIKYTPENGTVQIEAHIEKKYREIQIEVRDTGIGISEADLSSLFTEFFRTQAAREVSHEGTGLGLVLAKHVVEDMGGTIEVISKVNKGTKFIVHLPY